MKKIYVTVDNHSNSFPKNCGSNARARRDWLCVTFLWRATAAGAPELNTVLYSSSRCTEGMGATLDRNKTAFHNFLGHARDGIRINFSLRQNERRWKEVRVWAAPSQSGLSDGPQARRRKLRYPRIDPCCSTPRRSGQCQHCSFLPLMVMYCSIGPLASTVVNLSLLSSF